MAIPTNLRDWYDAYGMQDDYARRRLEAMQAQNNFSLGLGSLALQGLQQQAQEQVKPQAPEPAHLNPTLLLTGEDA